MVEEEQGNLKRSEACNEERRVLRGTEGSDLGLGSKVFSNLVNSVIH